MPSEQEWAHCIHSDQRSAECMRQPKMKAANTVDLIYLKKKVLLQTTQNPVDLMETKTHFRSVPTVYFVSFDHAGKKFYTVN